MRHLLAATCLTPVALVLAAPASAQVVINTARTTSISTSTANNGAASGIRVATGGSVRPTAAGGAVIVDSSNDVTNESSTNGGIGTTGVNNSTGILVNPNLTANINNASGGTISVVEDFTPADGDNDGDLDGLFAQGTNRYGIRVLPGGTLTGSIANAGTITVEGNNSAGISIESALAGPLTNNGSINVTGNDSYGIRANDITGRTRIAGAIVVRGGNSTAVALEGDITGALEFQGAISSTGYRYTTPPTNVSRLDADDLLQGGPAVSIEGNVTGGIIFAVAPPDNSTTNNDEDNDGIPDATEGASNIATFGAAPAIRIGSVTDAIAIGPIAGNTSGHGLIVNGTVAASGLYSDVAATAIQIGGRGGAVNVAGGMTIGATVTAASLNANATGLRIGNAATVDQIAVTTGSILASSGSSSASTQVEGIAIDAGATVNRITNSGGIRATLTGSNGNATAIMDRSGGLDLIENTGQIIAAGAALDTNRIVAIDVSANGGGVTVRQNAVAASATAPRIAGNIRFGAGNDVLDILDGTVAGNTTFGAGSNRLSLAGDAVYTGNASFGAGIDTIALAGTSAFEGNIDFGGGADTLTLAGTSSFRGRLANSASVAVSVAGGTFGVTNTNSVALASLSMGTGSKLNVTIDPVAHTNTLYDVAGAATFGTNTQVVVQLDTIAQSEGTFTILRAGTLTGGANLSADSTSLPYLYMGSVAANETTDVVTLTIRRKTATELGFNASEGAAYGAIFNALDADEQVADVFLGIGNAEAFNAAYRQLLPDHAGGTFETVTQASRTSARMLQDRRIPAAEPGRVGLWAQQVVWGTSKDLGNTAAYDVSGWGASAGAETPLGDAGMFGASFSYLLGKNADGNTDNQVDTNHFELAGYWRGAFGPLQAYARASGAFIKFEGLRRFVGTDGDQTVTRTTEGDWNGTLFSGTAGASYEIQSGRLSFRPGAAIEYYRLSEGAYTESGGGEAFDLSVDKRSGDELAATGTMTVGYDLGSMQPDGTWLRIEAEGGRREIVAGELGGTTARFAGGDDFTLMAEERQSGWVGRLRLAGGTPIFRLGGEFSAEEQYGKAAVAFRIGLNAAF
ncbi:autotransporter domain-containing protein [Allosphingosinicella flava]|uniref:Autotransporter domain-containing protein n=1 Tax=Allosphingosinicella flava TaxID=2771430 RepID=A0A7T2GLF9_9SPHN|nr:autotransporter outer membrane beta-barrel domain-containing protein [Sphingosinicella flava]QPQ56039.1 autotransporter domain-containing protein [Sphingosinicella flava]